MKLRKPCEHGFYDPHYWENVSGDKSIYGPQCPGGEFLADDALVIDPKNVEQVAEALVVLDALMVSFYNEQDNFLDESEKDDDALTVREDA